MSMSMSMSVCNGCGIVNSNMQFRCVACDERLDKPYVFKDKDDVFGYFSRGGFTDIAEALKDGLLTWDPADREYTQLLETAVILALEESFSTLDILFYASHPVLGGPYLGVRWPKNQLLDAIQLSFHSPDGDHRFTVLDRARTTGRGANYRFDSSLGKAGVEFELRLIAVYGKSGGPNRKYETPAIALRPSLPADMQGAYELVRPTTGIRVK